MFYDIYVSLCKKQNAKPYTVAREIGLGTSNVAQWKKGSTPRTSVLEKIADYFGVSVAYLLDLEQKEKTPAPEGDISPKMQEVFSEISDFSDVELALLLDRIEGIKKNRV